MLNMIRQTQKDNCHMFSPTCGIRGKRHESIRGTVRKEERDWGRGWI
jgi:hypothetical protein